MHIFDLIFPKQVCLFPKIFPEQGQKYFPREAKNISRLCLLLPPPPPDIKDLKQEEVIDRKISRKMEGSLATASS